MISSSAARPRWLSVPATTIGQGLAFPAADLGGTTIRVMLLCADENGRPRTVASCQVPTRRGLGALVEQLETALREASSQAAAGGYQTMPILAIGSPGRIEQQENRRVIAPRSAANLEAFEGELDGVDLASVLARGLAIPTARVFWDNDAVVQGRFLIAELLRQEPASTLLRGHSLVSIHPGTGLGGCVAAVADDGRVSVFTDSHISELSLHPLTFTGQLGTATVTVHTTATAGTIELELSAGEHTHSLSLASPNAKQAEDLIAGAGIARLARSLATLWREAGQEPGLFATSAATTDQVDGALLSQLLGTDSGVGLHAVQAAGLVADLAGSALARLMRVLHTGAVHKTPDFPDWAPQDVQRLQGVSRFVLGGGITKTRLGRRMIAHARTELQDLDELHLFEMAEIADGAGVIGAFFLIPEAIRGQGPDCDETNAKATLEPC